MNHISLSANAFTPAPSAIAQSGSRISGVAPTTSWSTLLDAYNQTQEDATAKKPPESVGVADQTLFNLFQDTGNRISTILSMLANTTPEAPRTSLHTCLEALALVEDAEAELVAQGNTADGQAFSALMQGKLRELKERLQALKATIRSKIANYTGSNKYLSSQDLESLSRRRRNQSIPTLEAARTGNTSRNSTGDQVRLQVKGQISQLETQAETLEQKVQKLNENSTSQKIALNQITSLRKDADLLRALLDAASA